MKKIRTVIPSAWDKPTNTTEQIIIVNIIVISIFLFIIAKLSQAQSNFNSVGWAEIALIPTFTHPPPGKVLRRQFQYSYRPNYKGRFVGPSLTDD